MADDRDREQKIKVVDKRWFNEQGELRQDRPAEPPLVTAKPQPSPPPDDPRPDPTQQSPQMGPSPADVALLDLVDFLAQQAVLLLRGAKGVPRSPQQARIFIDFLGLLQHKTMGNLTPEEARELEGVLFQLRSLYVQAGG